MPDPNLKRLTRKNLLYIVHHIVGTEIFRHIYVRDKTSGREFDALTDGSNACAFTVSGVLALVGLIDHPHATVATTIQQMQEAGWVPTKTPAPGDVVHWPSGDDGHAHLAFYIGDGKVVGNASSSQVPAEYGLALADGKHSRQPDVFYTHPALQEE